MNPLQELLVNTMSAEGLREVVRELIAEIERRNAIDAESMKKVERIQEVVQGLADQTEAVEACRKALLPLLPLVSRFGSMEYRHDIHFSVGEIELRVTVGDLARAVRAVGLTP